jgi:hypothetical protein
MEEEQVRQEADREARKLKGHTPFRFWTPANTTRQLIIIDEKPDFFRYEHALKDRKSGRYDNFLPCINADANCPLCGGEKPSYFGMYLTVIDCEGYEDRDGNWVEWSKKLLVVKPMQQKKIARLYEREGTLRGMVLDMTRDSDKDAGIGGDIEFVGWAEEEELHDYYTTYTDKDNNKHEVIGDEVFDYEALFPDMTEKQLAAIAGVDLGDSVGNRRGEDRSLGRGRGGREEAPARGGRTASRGGRREEAADDAPQRSARRGGRDTADDQQRPTRGRREAPADDAGDDQYDNADDQQQDAPQRPTRGSRQAREEAPAERPTRGRREQPAAEDPPQRAARSTRAPREEQQEEAPQRPSRGGGREAPQRTTRGRADAAHDDPPFEDGDDQGGEPAASPRGRAALRTRR